MCLSWNYTHQTKLPQWLSSKESTRGSGDACLPMQEMQEMSSIPGLGRFPEGGKWQPTPVFLPEKSHGQEEPGGL